MADTELENAAAATPGMGHNNPAETIAAEYDLLLKADPLLETFSREGNGKYLTMTADVATLLSKIGGRVEGIPGVPKVIETSTENGLIAGYMEDLRQIEKTVDTARVGEKAEYLKATRMIDGYFGSLAEKITATKDILQKRGNVYTARVAAQARAEAERVANEARIEAQRIAAAAQREREAALTAAAAAARARKPENIEKLEATAVAATVNAQTLAIDQMVQEQAADEARIATLASTAQLTRTKFASGHMASGKQVGYVEIVDINKIDLNLLRPYLKPDVILAALKKLGDNLDHKKPAEGLDGVIMEKRDAAHYR